MERTALRSNEGQYELVEIILSTARTQLAQLDIIMPIDFA